MHPNVIKHIFFLLSKEKGHLACESACALWQLILARGAVRSRPVSRLWTLTIPARHLEGRVQVDFCMERGCCLGPAFRGFLSVLMHCKGGQLWSDTAELTELAVPQSAQCKCCGAVEWNSRGQRAHRGLLLPASGLFTLVP